MQQGRCVADSSKAQLWLSRALKAQVSHAPMAHIYNLIDQQHLPKALALLAPLMKNNQLDALTLFANLKATASAPSIIDYQQSIKIARQAMAIDHDNPRLLAILALAHYHLNPQAQHQEQGQSQPKWQYLLSSAIAEAEYRDWPIDYYVNTLEKLQQQTLLQQIKAANDNKKAKQAAKHNK